MEKFKYSPEAGFLDSSSFPDPSNETQTREQLQELHNQVRDYINKMLTMLGTEAVMLRINAVNAIEFSIDGENWQEVIGRGERGPAGPGVVPGGTTGQFFRKKSNTDYDGEWTDLPVADTNVVGGVKAKSSTDSTIAKNGESLKVNQLVIDELEITDAPVQTLEEHEWWDEESEFMKYIDVLVEGCVATAKPDHWMMTSSFQEKCGSVQTLDGKVRFLLSTDITDATITTTVKELIIQYQD